MAGKNKLKPSSEKCKQIQQRENTPRCLGGGNGWTTVHEAVIWYCRRANKKLGAHDSSTQIDPSVHTVVSLHLAPVGLYLKCDILFRINNTGKLQRILKQSGYQVGRNGSPQLVQLNTMMKSDVQWEHKYSPYPEKDNAHLATAKWSLGKSRTWFEHFKILHVKVGSVRLWNILPTAKPESSNAEAT